MLLSAQANQFDIMLPRYLELLGFSSSVTRNEYSDMINKILNFVGESKSAFCEQVYQVTLGQLKSNSTMERVWFQTSIKLCRLYIANGNLDGAASVIFLYYS